MITQNEEVRLLRQAMDKLTESDRNLLEADLEEVTLRELSDRMKTSERLLVRRLQRARERLRASYIAEVEGLRFTRSLKGAVASADGASPIISNIIQECNRQLMHWLAAHPEDLLKVHPGTFERIVAELFADQGFEVEVITSWNQADGGVDIVAAKRLMSGIDVRLAIQCKRITQRKRVSAEPIRALSAVLEKFRAHAGVLAITSYFSRDALEESRKYFWRIALRDYDRIVKDLKDFCVFKKHPSGLWIPGYDPFGV
jgi:restriction endonuclease Mrr